MTESEGLFGQARTFVDKILDQAERGNRSNRIDRLIQAGSVSAICCAIEGLAETIRETTADPYLMTGFKTGGTD